MCATVLDVICCIYLHSLLHVVESGQIFEPATPNISFAPWSPKWSAMMLDLCTALPTLLGRHTCITHGLLELHSHVSQYSCANSFNLSILWYNALQVLTLLGVVASICITTANTIHQLLIFFGPTILGVVVSVCTLLKEGYFWKCKPFFKHLYQT